MVNEGRGRCRILPPSEGRMTVYDGRNLAAVAVRMVSGCFAAFALGYFAFCRPLKRLFVLRFSAIQSTLLTGWRAAKSSATAGQKTGYIDCKSKDKAMGMEDGRYGTFLC
jgi:hypothetical protein